MSQRVTVNLPGAAAVMPAARQTGARAGVEVELVGDVTESVMTSPPVGLRTRRRVADRRIDPLLQVREARQGRRPGDAYVKIVRPYDELFPRGDEGELIATERTVLDRPGWTKTLRSIRTVLIGRPISSEQEEHERLTELKALAIFSSDNISSSAYATEEMMRILVLAGIGAISLTMPLTVVICVVLGIVATSYWQTIRAYPNGASSYLVSSDNLGRRPGWSPAPPCSSTTP